MSIEIQSLDDADEWNDVVERSAHTTGFHLAEALDILADESGTRLDRLVGYKGEEPCGLLPVFTTRFGPLSVAFSPPPSLKINYLGPALLNVGSMKQRRREQRHSRFIDAAVEWLGANRGLNYATIRTAPGYNDVRPLLWNDFDAVPKYTYVVDLARSNDELLSAFSRDARDNITSEYDVDFEIVEGGYEDVGTIVEAVQGRHEEVEEPFPATVDFVERLYERVPEGVLRPLICRSNGQFVGGTIAVELGNMSIGWLGVSNFDVDLPTTDLLDWRYFQDARDRGVKTFDLAGANLRRLSQYKAKFGSDLVPYYRVEYGSTGVKAAAKMYGRLRH